MINHKEIEQGSIEWHEIKWRKIGGTLSKGLFVDSDTLFIDLLSQHLEEFEPSESFENYDMQRGKEMEPFALDYISKYAGVEFLKTGWLQSEECSLFGLSPDGITECETISAEIKCFARKKHTEILLSQEIPSDNIAQCLHYFTVNPKLQKHYFVAYRPESVKPFIQILTRDSVIDLGLKEVVEIPQFGVKGQPIKPKIEKNPMTMPIDWFAKESIIRGNKLKSVIEEKVKQLNF